jgi:hypothetical protein
LFAGRIIIVAMQQICDRLSHNGVEAMMAGGWSRDDRKRNRADQNSGCCGLQAARRRMMNLPAGKVNASW